MDFKPFKIGKYLLLEKIATGGMAEVFRAKASGAGGFEKQLAIKRILPNYASNDEFRRMFEYEARLSSMLTHANIAQIYDFVKNNETYLLAMEFVDGKNLRQFINKAKKISYTPPVEFGLYIINEVCKGLDYAHKKKDDMSGKSLNVIHRDMSPQNIMLSYDGAVKIVDFGIAKARDRVDETRSGVIKGKFGYMSPEQANGEQVDLRTDIFSTGIILYELLCSRRLFAGDNDMATLRQIQECVVPSAGRQNSKVTSEMEKILMKALTKDLGLRYQSAGNFHRSLQEYLNKHFSSFSQREMADILQKTFADEIVAEKKRFEAVYRQSIPFSQKALSESRENSDGQDEQEARDPEEPETKSETRNRSVVTNLSGEEMITSISGVFKKNEPRSDRSKPEDSGNESPLTKIDSLIPDEESSQRFDPITGTDTFQRSVSEPSTPPTQAKSVSTVGKSRSKTFGGEKTQITDSGLSDNEDNSTQFTGSRAKSEPKLKTDEGRAPEVTSASGISLHDTAAKPKGRRRERSVSLSRDISTSGGGQRVSLQTYGNPNELEIMDRKVLERTQRNPYHFSDRKKGSPVFRFALIVTLIGMGLLYLKDKRPTRVTAEQEESRVPNSEAPNQENSVDKSAIDPGEQPEEKPAKVQGAIVPRAYGDCAVDVVTDPPGARMIINKVDRGLTNTIASGECGKSYNVSLELEGYEEVQENIVFRGKKGRLTRQLKKVPMGSMELVVNQNAELFINGQSSGEVTSGVMIQKNLRAGRSYQLRFINKVFKIDETCNVVIQTDKVERRTIKLGEGKCKP